MIKSNRKRKVGLTLEPAQGSELHVSGLFAKDFHIYLKARQEKANKRLNVKILQLIVPFQTRSQRVFSELRGLVSAFKLRVLRIQHRI